MMPKPGDIEDGHRFKGGDAGDPNSWEPVTGGDYLKSLDPQTATQVRALSEGRMQFPSGFAISKPYWQQMLSHVAAYDPTFDSVNYSARSKTRNDFTSGKSAQNITALNTVIGHMDQLDKGVDKLGNYSGTEPGPILGIPLGPLAKTNNKMARFLADASGTDARYRTFETDKEAVANELTRVFRQAGGAEADIQAWKKQLDTASSPQTLHAVVTSMAHLINSRLESVGKQYDQGMGTTKDPLTLLAPDKANIFRRLEGQGAPSTPNPYRPGAKAAPATPRKMSDDDIRKALGW